MKINNLYKFKLMKNAKRLEKYNFEFSFCPALAGLYSRRFTTAPNKAFTLRFACPSVNHLRQLREYKALTEPVSGG